MNAMYNIIPTRKKLSIYYINSIVLTINFHYKFEVILSWGYNEFKLFKISKKKNVLMLFQNE